MTNIPHDESGIASMVEDDPDRVRRLRATLAVVARRTEDPELRALIGEVLAGRQNVRRALLHPSMFAMAERNLENLEEGLDRLDPEEREDVLSRVGVERTDDEIIERLRSPSSDGRGGLSDHLPRNDRDSRGTW